MAKVMVSLPDDLLRRIDEAAQTQGKTRSGYLADAVRRLMADTQQESTAQAVSFLEKIFAEAPAFEAAKIIRADRDARDLRDSQRAQPC